MAAIEEDAARASAATAPIDGAALVREVESFIGRFVVLPAGTLLPVTLWTVATHLFEVFSAFPYLVFLSPVKQCGKTLLTEVIELIAANAQRTVGISEAALFRLVEEQTPTLVLDEAEFLTGRSERAEAIRALLNAGNRSGTVVLRCVGSNHDLKKFRVYCPKIVCGIGHCPDTIRDRSIPVLMQRRRPGEQVERFLPRRLGPEATRLQKQLAAFAEAHKGEVQAVYEKARLEDRLPGLRDRELECWEPLFALLAVADSTRIDEICRCAQALAGQKAAADEDDSLTIKLLSDIREVWPKSERTILTADVLRRLQALEESPWAKEIELTPRKLSRMLRPFGLSPRSVRTPARAARGFHREDAEPVFARYLPGEGPKSH